MSTKRKGPRSPQGNQETPLQFDPIDRPEYRALRPYNVQHLYGFPVDHNVSKLGSTMQSRFTDGFNMYLLGSTFEGGELYHVWVVLNCYDLHKRLDGVIDVKVSTGEVFVRTENDDDIFYTTMGDVNQTAPNNIHLYFNDKKTEFASIINASLHDFNCKDDQFTIQRWDKRYGVNVDVNRKIRRFPTIAERFTVTRVNPTRLLCVMRASILEPTWKALGLILTLKAGYSLFQLHRLPQPTSLLFREPLNNCIPETTPSIMGYMLAKMREVCIRPAMRNCQGEVWMDIMNEASEILLTMYYELPQGWGAAVQKIQFKDTYGVTQINATGIGIDDRMDVVAAWKVNGQEYKFGHIEPDLNSRGDVIFDRFNQAVMYEHNIVKAKNFPIYNESASDDTNPDRKLFIGPDSGPFNYDILSPKCHVKLAEVKAEESTAVVKFVSNEMLNNDWKILILAQVWRRVHYDYILFRLSPFMCNKQYGWRLPMNKGPPIPTDWSGVTKLAERMRAL